MKRVTLIGLVFMVFGCSHSFSGRVINEEGADLSSSEGRLNIISLDSKDRQSTSLEILDGEFATDQVFPKGEYLIEVIVPGYKVKSSKVRLEGNEHLEMVLTKLANVKTNSVGLGESNDSSRGSGTVNLMPPKL